MNGVFASTSNPHWTNPGNSPPVAHHGSYMELDVTNSQSGAQHVAGVVTQRRSGNNQRMYAFYLRYIPDSTSDFVTIRNPGSLFPPGTGQSFAQ